MLLSRELAARGHNVALVAFELSGGLPDAVDGVHVLARAPYRAHRRLVGKVVETSWIWRSLWRGRADVVVKRAAGIDVGIVGFFARLLGQRFVFSSANIVDFSYSKLMPNRRDLLLYRLGVRLANEVVVQTDEQQQLCEQHFKRSPATIRSIAQPAADPPPGVADAKFFLWAGRLVSYKRPLAFVALARALPHARFVMVGVPTPHAGAEQLNAEVREAAEALPNLDLVDPMPRSQLGELIQSSVAVVNTADYEGMSNVLLEGWSRGIPSLALTHDPDGVVACHGLGGFAGGSMELLVEQAEAMWSARHDRDELSARCRNYVARHHAPSVVAAQWENVLGLARPADTLSDALVVDGGEPACAE